MFLRPLLPLLASLSLLSGCLQVELAGPVAGATITITPLGGGSPLASGLTTTDVTAVRNDIGEQVWEDLNNAGKAAFLGVVEIPDLELVPGNYYLVTATGGVDMDGDANGIVDNGGTAVQRQVRAIMSGAQLSRPFNRVTLLSEAVYRTLEPELDELTNKEIGKRLNEIARNVVSDITGDKRVNYNDVLQWSHFYNKSSYKGPAVFLERLPRALHDTLYSDEIATLDSINVTENASFKPYPSDNVWRGELVGCAFAVIVGDLCTMNTLPLIGMETTRPEIADIMARLVSSDPWIRERFEQVLAIMPEDVLILFRSVTTVVIGNEIRPSFFDPGTAAIQLDAGRFWLEPEERRTVSTEPDFRQEFGDAVNFADLWRYVKDDTDAFEALYDADDLGRRELADIELSVASLLLHELAHATDNIRPDFIDILPRDVSLAGLIIPTISDELQVFRPLTSDKMAGLANVLYFGVKPTPAETNYSATQVGSFFAPDAASDPYSYASQFEDLAMLFEEAMMAILYDVQRDVAFTTVPADDAEDDSCSAYRVGWGMRGRITAARVLPGAKLVVDALLPNSNYSAQLDQLAKPDLLDTSKDWCDSVELNGRPGVSSYVLRNNMKSRIRHTRRRH